MQTRHLISSADAQETGPNDVPTGFSHLLQSHYCTYRVQLLMYGVVFFCISGITFFFFFFSGLYKAVHPSGHSIMIKHYLSTHSFPLV